MMYQVNILQVIHRLVAWFVRSEGMVAWLWSILYPLHQAAVSWQAYALSRQRQVRYNGQVMVLERMLNLTFLLEDKWATAADPTASGGIYIDNTGTAAVDTFVWNASESALDEYVYNAAETLPSGANEVYVYADAESSSLGYQFIVYVPSSLTYNEQAMRDVIDRYVVAGVAYIIDTY